MNREEAVSFLKTRMKNNQSAELDAIIHTEMNFVQLQELERGPFFPWFLETELADAVTAPDEYRVALPEDFICEVEEQDLWVVVEGKPRKLTKVSSDTATAAQLEYGIPKGYDIRGKYFLMFPTPDAEYTLRMTYIARQPLLAEGTTNAWLDEAGQWFLGRTGENISLNVLGDMELAQRFQHMAQTGRKLVHDLDIERRETNRVRQMGVK